MRAKLTSAILALGLLFSLVFLVGAPRAQAAPELKCEAILVWGTNDTNPPPGKAYTPVEPAIAQRLKKVPLKWTHYFEVRRTAFKAPAGVEQDVHISDKCQLKVKRIGSGSEFEVVLIGQGKNVWKHKQPLSKGDMLVLGGDVPDRPTSWLVVIRRLE